jgi:hypothetical protein
VTFPDAPHRCRVSIRTALVAVVVSAAACVGPPCTHGSGETATRSFEFRDFDEVRRAGFFDVRITIASEFSVTAIADDNILPLADVSMNEDALVVLSKGGTPKTVDLGDNVRVP